MAQIRETKTPAVVSLINNNNVLKRFVEKTGGDEAFAKRFKNELLTVVTTNKYLQNCSVQSILTAAGQAATLKLSISPSLGYAYIIPYKGEATFQIGYKGLIQLAQRTGLYRRIRGVEVYEGELKDYNRLTGDFSFGQRISDQIIGFLAYFELLNGFQCMLFISKEEMETHAMTYSQSYRSDKNKGWTTSIWSTQFNKMGIKTVVKMLLSKYGPMSVDMQQAITADQSVVSAEGKYTYVDNQHDDDKYDEVLDSTADFENDYVDEDETEEDTDTEESEAEIETD